VIFTKTLIARLVADEERSWAVYGRTGKPITDRKVAELLRPFGIISGTVRIGDITNKGYKLPDFKEAWQRWGVEGGHPVWRRTRQNTFISSTSRFPAVTTSQRC
jgi:hypothetical protein